MCSLKGTKLEELGLPESQVLELLSQVSLAKRMANMVCFPSSFPVLFPVHAILIDLPHKLKFVGTSQSRIWRETKDPQAESGSIGQERQEAEQEGRYVQRGWREESKVILTSYSS